MGSGGTAGSGTRPPQPPHPKVAPGLGLKVGRAGTPAGISQASLGLQGFAPPSTPAPRVGLGVGLGGHCPGKNKHRQGRGPSASAPEEPDAAAGRPVPTGQAMGGPWSTCPPREGWEHGTSPEDSANSWAGTQKGWASLPRSQPVLHPLGAVGAVLMRARGWGREGSGESTDESTGGGGQKGSGYGSQASLGNRGSADLVQRWELAWRPRAHVLLGAFFVT